MTRTEECKLCMENQGDRWTLTLLPYIKMQRLNNCFEYISIYDSIFVFRSVHFIDCIFRSMIDESTFYHSRLRTTAMFLQVLIWKLNWKPLSAFRIFCLTPFKATGQWITQISLIRWGPNTALTWFLISIYTQAYYPTLGISSKKRRLGDINHYLTNDNPQQSTIHQ